MIQSEGPVLNQAGAFTDIDDRQVTMTVTKAARHIRAITAALLDWYADNARDLPWRRSPSPYAVLVSEIMLQQTQVSTVIPFFLRWMERFPDFQALARATEEEVVKLWEGLGYYRRARSLHALARVVTEDCGGRLPADEKALLALPGIGPYTAGAVLSIAFNLPFPAVDGNVDRVLARLFDLKQPVDKKDGKAEVRRLARQLIRQGEPRHLSQALMELGATVCTPGSPLCPVCPLTGACRAHRRGTVSLRPVKSPRPETIRLFRGALLAERDGRLLLFRRPTEIVMGGLWEFPTFTFVSPPGREDVERSARNLLGLQTDSPARQLGVFRHAFTRYRVTLKAFHAKAPKGSLRPLEGWETRWAEASRIPSLPFSAGSRKIRDSLCLPHTPNRARERGSRDILMTTCGGD